MSTASTRLPEGRYGRSSDERADRKLKIAATVLGAALLALVAYFAYHYIAQNEISAQVVSFQASDDAVKVHLEVHKDSGTDGYCTLRSQGPTAPRSAGRTSVSPGRPHASTRSSRSVRRPGGRRPSCWAATPADAGRTRARRQDSRLVTLPCVTRNA